MPKANTSFICQQCGYKSPQFLGRCPECGSWNSLVETIEENAKSVKLSKKALKETKIVNLSDIEKIPFDRLSVRINEFDRVLGGGIVPGSIILVSGEPGIGKSTLLLQLALNLQNQNKNDQKDILYVAGEESAQQIKIRADRIISNAKLSILNEIDVDIVSELIDTIRPALVIIDSIQTLQTSDLNSIPGSISQVRESAYRLQQLAKKTHIPIILVGHITKEGTIAGPKTLEHLVDVVLTLEGDSTLSFRMLRASKNRFGSTDEIGIFDMEEKGMVEINDPSSVFLNQTLKGSGSAITCTMAGLRPLLIEIQALVTKSLLPIPRRIGNNLDNNRLQLLVAVLSKRLNLPIFNQDIFVNITGGIKVFETSIDLAVCLAIISSLKEKIIPKNLVLIGEVGLQGEIRAVKQIDKRISEAKKLGFNQIISPYEAKTLSEAVNLAFTK